MDIKDLIFYINKFKAECEKLKPINDDKISIFLCEKDFEEFIK